jgi:hypothetical protein
MSQEIVDVKNPIIGTNNNQNMSNSDIIGKKLNSGNNGMSEQMEGHRLEIEKLQRISDRSPNQELLQQEKISKYKERVADNEHQSENLKKIDNIVQLGHCGDPGNLAAIIKHRLTIYDLDKLSNRSPEQEALLHEAQNNLKKCLEEHDEERRAFAIYRRLHAMSNEMQSNFL